MSFVKTRQPVSEKREFDVTKCAAYGCKCRATVRVEGGTWCCGAHAFAMPDDWQRITNELQAHDWLIGLIDDLRKMARTHQDWRGFAAQFWHGTDDFCKPDTREADVVYQNRMRGELLHRCGLSARRPEPRIPQLVRPSGQFARKAVA